MDIERIKEEFLKIKWYKQGVSSRLLYMSYPLSSCHQFTIDQQSIPYAYKIKGIYKDNFVNWYFPCSNMEEIAGFYWERQKKNPLFIEELNKKWKDDFEKFLSFVENMDFNKLRDKELMDLYNDFSKKYLMLWNESIFLDSFDVMGITMLDEVLKVEEIDLDDDEKNLLACSDEMTWVQKERAQLLKICDKFKDDNELLNILDIGELSENFPEVYDKIKEHTRNFYWIGVSFEKVKRFESDFFFKELHECIKNKEEYNQERRIIKEAEEVKERKEKLYKKIKKHKELLMVGKFLSTISKWRDDRKAFMQVGGSIIRMFVEEIVKRVDFSEDEIEDMYYWEVENIFNFKREYLDLALRNKGFFVMQPDLRKEGALIYGKEGFELKRFIDEIMLADQELKGRPAFKGVVKGKVKIILSQDDFGKMNKGDVLIAPNTRPEYVSIMKIAGAIISEEGGITCHSAVVSRELKIPCIVGVQGVTLALKDGDLVEVDAAQGRVTILGNKK